MRPAEAAVAEDFSAAKNQVRGAVEDYLRTAFARYSETEVSKAAQYVVLGGGHRWRAIVAVAAGQIFDDDALNIALPCGCGIELAHAASLVLDDLPSMDDAEVRRGKPCAHRVFPSWAVEMTPVFLVTLAYQISLDNPLASEDRRVRGALLLSAAGLDMIEGQVRDVTQAHKSAEEGLLDCYLLKSASLYAAAAKAGAIMCGAGCEDADRIHAAGRYLGMSYQMLDDVADVVAGVDDVGKQSGMDTAKWTAVDWLGVDGARAKSREFQSMALAALDDFDARADWLRTLVCEASWKSA